MPLELERSPASTLALGSDDEVSTSESLTLGVADEAIELVALWVTVCVDVEMLDELLDGIGVWEAELVDVPVDVLDVLVRLPEAVDETVPSGAVTMSGSAAETAAWALAPRPTSSTPASSRVIATRRVAQRILVPSQRPSEVQKASSATSAERNSRPTDLVLLLAVTLLGAAPRLFRVWRRPDGFAWDEAYYVPAARSFLDGDFAVNLEHPPLGKWAVAAGIWLLGDEPLGWRLASLVAGIAVIPLTWLLAHRLLRSRVWATVAAGFVAIDGLLIVQSRTAVLDSLLTPLVVGAVLATLRHRDRHDRDELSGWLVLAGVLLGAAIACKWEAAPVLVGAILLWIVPPGRTRATWRTTAVAFLAVPLAVYVVAHLGSIVDAGTEVGAFFRQQWDAMNYHRKFRLHHDRGSPAWTWLWLRTPPSYGSERLGNHLADLVAVGTPVLWWGFLLALPHLAVVWWKQRDQTVEVVLFALLTLYLPWLVVLRPGFLYYVTPLVPFMALGLTYSLRALWDRGGALRVVPVGALVAAALAFVALLPLWTFTTTEQDRYDLITVLPDWSIDPPPP